MPQVFNIKNLEPWRAIAHADFFTTELWTWHGLVTFYTAFVIDLATRRVQVLGITRNPDEALMRQVVRTFTALRRDRRQLNGLSRRGMRSGDSAGQPRSTSLPCSA